MLHQTVLLCFLGVAAAHGGFFNDYKKYTELKIMSSCYGEDVVMGFMKEMKMATEEVCRSQQVDSDVDVTQFMNELRYRRKNQYPMMIPVYYQPQQWGFQQQPYQQYGNYYGYPNQQQQFQGQFQQPQGQFQQPQYRQQQQPFQQQPFQQQQYTQQNQFPRTVYKRETTLPTMEEYEGNVRAMISNVTCVLRAMNLIDKENQPNFKYASDYIQQMTISEDLKADLMEDYEFCREFSMCMPVHKMKDPLVKELGYPLSFMKCMNMKKFKTCMRHDQRKMYQSMATPGEQSQYTFNYNSPTEFLTADHSSQSEGDMTERISYVLNGGVFDF